MYLLQETYGMEILPEGSYGAKIMRWYDEKPTIEMMQVHFDDYTAKKLLDNIDKHVKDEYSGNTYMVQDVSEWDFGFEELGIPKN